MNNITLSGNLLLSPVDQVCTFGSLPFTVLTFLTIIVGLIGNIFILVFSYKQIQTSCSVYTVLLTNLSFNNLFGIVVSLPSFYIDYCTTILKTSSFEIGRTVYFIQLFIQINCLGVGMHTLAAMCYDRYEAFTKLPVERTLSISRAKKLSFLIWVYATFSILLCFTGHFMSSYEGGFSPMSLKVGTYYKQTQHTKISVSFVIALVTVWMFTCNTTYSLCLRRVHLEITQHSSQVESMLGPRRVQIEINLYKIAVVTIVMYSILWIPYGVTQVLLGVYGVKNFPVVCVYACSLQLSYLPFGILPYIYIMSDKKARKKFLSFGRIMRCKGGVIQPSVEE